MLICLLHLRLFACLSLCLIVCFYVCPYLCPYLYVCLFVSLSTIPYAAKYAFINYWRNGRTNDGQLHRRRLWGSQGASPPIFWKCPYTYPLLPHFAPPPKKKKLGLPHQHFWQVARYTHERARELQILFPSTTLALHNVSLQWQSLPGIGVPSTDALCIQPRRNRSQSWLQLKE